jgi:hypothetical protein
MGLGLAGSNVALIYLFKVNIISKIKNEKVNRVSLIFLIIIPSPLQAGSLPIFGIT